MFVHFPVEASTYLGAWMSDAHAVFVRMSLAMNYTVEKTLLWEIGSWVPVLFTWLNLVWHPAVPDDKNDPLQETKYQSIMNCTWQSNLWVSTSFHHGTDSKTLQRCVHVTHMYSSKRKNSEQLFFCVPISVIVFTPAFGISFADFIIQY
jgi:hypothetical protein